MTSDPGSPDRHSSDDLKVVLRRVFESQIPNYGDYNLVGATPGGGGARSYYVVGYRWNPAELVFAPFDPAALTGLEPPTAVNSTNLSHAEEVAGGDFEVGTNAGRVFRFSVLATAPLPVGGPGSVRTLDGRAVDGRPIHGRALEQEADLADFHSFLDHFLTLA